MQYTLQNIKGKWEVVPSKAIKASEEEGSIFPHALNLGIRRM